MKISFIGFGHIAKAMTKQLLKNPQYQLFAAAPSLSIGINQNGIHTHSSNTAILSAADIVILAAKPFQIPTILAEIKPALSTNTLLISVVAGLPLTWIENHCLPQQPITRAMPNLPIEIGEGAIPLIANNSVSSQQKQHVETLFKSLGLTTWVTQEEDLNRFTALSGSGPAYIFLFLEALIRAGVQMGLDKKQAELFVLQTTQGALHLIQQRDTEIGILRQEITSAKGTTDAAIQFLQQHGFETLVEQAVFAAYSRAQQLGQFINHS